MMLGVYVLKESCVGGIHRNGSYDMIAKVVNKGTAETILESVLDTRYEGLWQREKQGYAWNGRVDFVATGTLKPGFIEEINDTP